MAQKFEFTEQQRLDIDKSLTFLMKANKGKPVLISFHLSPSVVLDIRANCVNGNNFLTVMVTFNLHSYCKKSLLKRDIFYYSNIKPALTFNVCSTFYSYLDGEKMSVVSVDNNPKYESLIINAWQNLTKSKLESPAEESVFNQKSCQTSKKQTE